MNREGVCVDEDVRERVPTLLLRTCLAAEDVRLKGEFYALPACIGEDEVGGPCGGLAAVVDIEEDALAGSGEGRSWGGWADEYWACAVEAGKADGGEEGLARHWGEL